MFKPFIISVAENIRITIIGLFLLTLFGFPDSMELTIIMGALVILVYSRFLIKIIKKQLINIFLIYRITTSSSHYMIPTY